MNYKVIKNKEGKSILVRDIPKKEAKVEEPKVAPKKTTKKVKEVVVE